MLDESILRAMQRLRRRGRNGTTVQELARMVRAADPVQVLGAAERVKRRYGTWIRSGMPLAQQSKRTPR